MWKYNGVTEILLSLKEDEMWLLTRCSHPFPGSVLCPPCSVTVGQTGLSDQSDGKWAGFPGSAGLVGILTRSCYLMLIGGPTCNI